MFQSPTVFRIIVKRERVHLMFTVVPRPIYESCYPSLPRDPFMLSEKTPPTPSNFVRISNRKMIKAGLTKVAENNHD